MYQLDWKVLVFGIKLKSSSYCRDLFKWWGFPTPVVDFPRSLKIISNRIVQNTGASLTPTRTPLLPPEETAIDNPVLVPGFERWMDRYYIRVYIIDIETWAVGRPCTARGLPDLIHPKLEATRSPPQLHTCTHSHHTKPINIVMIHPPSATWQMLSSDHDLDQPKHFQFPVKFDNFCKFRICQKRAIECAQ